MRFRLIALFCVASSFLAAADVKVMEQIVAKVNGEIVTRGELDKGRRLMEEQMKEEKVPAAQIPELIKQKEPELLTDQIDNLLLVSRAKDLNINVDSEVTKYFASVQTQQKISDPDQFKAWAEKEMSMPYEDLRLMIKNRFLAQRVLRQEVGSKINIPTQDLRKFYDEHKDEFIREEQVFLREIVISLAGKNAAEVTIAERRARDILDRIKKGEKFPELARDLSEGKSADNFGEVGWIKKEDIRPELRDLFSQKKGYVTDVLKLGDNLVIFKLEERHEKGLAAYEDVENEIMERMFEPRMEPRRREYLTKLREDAFLEIRAGYVEAFPAPGKDTAWKDPAQLKPETTTKEEVAARVNAKRRLLWMIPLKPSTPEPTSPALVGPAFPAEPPPSQR